MEVGVDRGVVDPVVLRAATPYSAKADLHPYTFKLRSIGV